MSYNVTLSHVLLIRRLEIQHSVSIVYNKNNNNYNNNDNNNNNIA